jgi:membrane fusion protein, multidrug efflux system
MTPSPGTSRHGLPRRGLVLFSVLLAAGCGPGDEAGPSTQPEAVPVGVWTVQAESVVLERSWAARLEPLRTVPVQAPRGGRVTAVQVRDGDRVERGALLVRMVGPDLEGRGQAAEARRDQLREELERWERLAAAGAAGPGEVAAARLRFLEASESLAELEAQVESYLVRAPTSGSVYGTVASPGGEVAAGQVLLQVEDDDSWGVRLSLPAWEAPLFADPDRLVIEDALGNRLPVDRWASASELEPGFVRIDLYLTTERPARQAVDVRYREEEELLLVPWTAVAEEDDGHWVALVVPGEPPRIQRRPVELGRPHARGVEVTAGLEEGDRIVRYEPRLHPEGRPVTPVEDPS